MPEDLSYLLETPSEEETQRVRAAVEAECVRAICTYLTEVADTMDANSLETLTPAALRAMAATLNQRLENDENQAN